ncbi:MAG: isoprenylcysteine carboxylmethyltransferase family protein [Candidatus Heimdallarchaeota archaeon]|nr:isoprenylcysteine carboxylmethyltransferase family protein [Candidatus Heimdallarchaeota archaeon]
MNITMRIVIQKIMFIVIVYVVYYTGIYLWLMPEVFDDPFVFIYLILLYTGGILDTIIRPLETEKKEEGGFEKILALLFLINPFLLILAMFEVTYYPWRNPIISIIGLVIYLSGIIMLLWSRINLGKQATGILVIRDDHELITNGIYKYVRHPIYGAGIIGVLGFMLVTQSIIIGLLSLLIYFKVLNDRAKYEEEMLCNEFTEYPEYMTKTKRFIPFVF